MSDKKRYWTGARKAPAQDRFFIEALDPDLWAPGDKDSWDACWHTGMPAARIFKAMRPGQTINHIPGNSAVTVKSMLYETLRDAQGRVEGDERRARFGFFPRSFSMPEDYHALQREGFRHPDKKWIAKPKRLSRGRGISVHADAATLPNDAKWLAQEYLADAHLYDGYKYVLRCYVLISSVDPLRVYLYKDGFVKLASELYRHGDYNNLYAHLTNPDVNALNEGEEASVVFHSFDTYRAWLRREGGDPEALFDGIRDIAILTAIAAREQMRARINASGAISSGCYELIGLDCMIDTALKPWLLECNLSPSLEVCAEPGSGGRQEEATKRAVVADMVALIGLNRERAPLGPGADKNQIIAEATDEQAHAGGFERIFPGEDAGEFLPFFPAPRYGDVVLARAISKIPPSAVAMQPAGDQAFEFGSALALFSQQTGQFTTPNEVRAFIWLKASQGAAADAIADEMASLTGASEAEREALSRQVLDALCDWTQAGLLIAPDAKTQTEAPTGPNENWHCQEWLSTNESPVRLRYGAAEILPRLETLIAPLRAGPSEPAIEIDILRGKVGYAIARGSQLVRSGLRLSQIADALRDIFLDAYAAGHADQLCCNASLCTSPQGTIVFASNDHGCWDALALSYANITNGAFVAGACALGPAPGEAEALIAPGRIGEAAAEAIGGGGDYFGDCIQEWRAARGYFIPCKEDNGGGAHKIGMVVIPMFDAAATAELSEMDGPDGLQALNAMRRNGQAPLGFDGARLLYEWRQAVRVFELRYSDASDAARCITEKLLG
jgi:Tubulin-tyrosine ligase family